MVTYVLTHNVKARDPVGSKDYITYPCCRNKTLPRLLESSGSLEVSFYLEASVPSPDLGCSHAIRCYFRLERTEEEIESTTRQLTYGYGTMLDVFVAFVNCIYFTFRRILAFRGLFCSLVARETRH